MSIKLLKKIKIKNKWRDHPWSKSGMIDEIPVELLALIANPAIKKDHLEYPIDDAPKDTEKDWKSIRKDGLKEPLLIVINKDRKSIRLETGNAHVLRAIRDGVEKLPVATFVMPTPVINQGNGNHFFSCLHLLDSYSLPSSDYAYQIKLSDVAYYGFDESDLAGWASNISPLGQLAHPVPEDKHKSYTLYIIKELLSLVLGHPFRLHQTKYCKDWDKVLSGWMDIDVPYKVDKHTVTFYFPGGDEVDVWKSNRWYSYAHLYRINSRDDGMKLRPSLKTTWRFYLLTVNPAKSLNEAKKENMLKLKGLFGEKD